MTTNYLIKCFTYTSRGLEMEICATTREKADEIIAIHNTSSKFHWVYANEKLEGINDDPATVEQAEMDNALAKLNYRRSHNA